MEDLLKGCLYSIGLMIGGLIMSLLFIFAFAFFAMLAWNYVMPDLFGLPEITFWKMIVLQILIYLLFPAARINYNRKS